MKGKRKNNNDESTLPPTIKTKKGRRNKQPEGGPSTSGEQVRLIDYSLLISWSSALCPHSANVSVELH